MLSKPLVRCIYTVVIVDKESERSIVSTVVAAEMTAFSASSLRYIPNIIKNSASITFVLDHISHQSV